MGDVAPILGPNSAPRHVPREALRFGSTIEIGTVGWDPDKEMIGSSPIGGSSTSDALWVPQIATEDQRHRYLFRLCSVAVPPNSWARLRGLRQLLTIGAVRDLQGGEGPPAPRVFEHQVTDPLWHFAKGNVSWHVRVIWGRAATDVGPTQGTSKSQSTDLYQTGSALLNVGPAFRYVPPAGGEPPGSPVERVGNFTSMRFPHWTPGTEGELDMLISGPCKIGFWASVCQPPVPRGLTERLIAPAGVSAALLGSALRAEDQFLLLFPDALYRHIGGAMILDLGELYGV